MTYNILNGATEALPQVIDVVRAETPDYLTLNETNTFAKNDHKILKEFAQAANFPYFDMALSGEGDYHVAIFSKYPFQETHKLQPLARACFIAVVNTELGPISIASLHLTPSSEDERLPEIDLILAHQNRYKHKILMGDMNSLSPDDGYNPAITKNFNDMQLKKFTTAGKLRFDAIQKILATGYTDPAVTLGKNREHTAPTSINEYYAHSDMRLDYIFLSASLLSHLQSYAVIKNTLTETASDHYPVTVTLL